MHELWDNNEGITEARICRVETAEEEEEKELRARNKLPDGERRRPLTKALSSFAAAGEINVANMSNDRYIVLNYFVWLETYVGTFFNSSAKLKLVIY